MTLIVLYDDARARSFEPFASTRPVSELVAGTRRIRERWASVLQSNEPAQFVAGERLVNFDEGDGTRAVTGTIPSGSIVVNARCVPALPADATRASQRARTSSLWRCKDQLA